MTRTSGFETREKVEKAAFYLFSVEQNLQSRKSVVQAIFFFSALTSLFTNNYVLYITAVIAFIASAASFSFRFIANRKKTLGHLLHRTSILAKAYEISDDSFDTAYLLSSIPTSLNRFIPKSIGKMKVSGTYKLPPNQIGSSKLRWMIQENAFFNTTLYGACANQAIRKLVIFTGLFLLLIFLILPITDGVTEYIILRIILVTLSLDILYDQIDQCLSWSYASKSMQEIENELARLKTVPEHRILLLFSNYQVIISSTPAIKEDVYVDNEERLNNGWEQRQATLSREWSNAA